MPFCDPRVLPESGFSYIDVNIQVMANGSILKFWARRAPGLSTRIAIM
jgi:hypothetical protein